MPKEMSVGDAGDQVVQWRSYNAVGMKNGTSVGRAAGVNRPAGTEEARRRAVRFREIGFTLRRCAAAAGVHVATLCRWQVANPDFGRLMRDARDFARRVRLRRSMEAEASPPVRWRRDCPLCKARVAVRTAKGKVPFWRCGRWPLCPWASWRPRAPRDCGHCGAPRYWSHSRQSIGCSGCGRRTERPRWRPAVRERCPLKGAQKTSKTARKRAK